MTRLAAQPAVLPDMVSSVSVLDRNLQRAEAEFCNSSIASVVHEPLMTSGQPPLNNNLSQGRHDFSSVQVRTESGATDSRYTEVSRPTMRSEVTLAPLQLQPKLTVNEPGDKYEQEAGHIAEPIMRMPDADVGVQRKCAKCEDDEKTVRRKEATASAGPAYAPPCVHAVLNSPGEPLDAASRSFFEPRFGRDFSQVRIHNDAAAAQSAQNVSARAFTVGSDIVFNKGEHAPGEIAGRRLLAHELVHTVQQGGAPRLQRQSADQTVERHISNGETFTATTGFAIQRWPGDGMIPPGDCDWSTYIPLRGSVETAKAVVSMLGSCSAGDSCLFLATKIAAITAEIAARVALDTSCFKGGDTGHRQQVQDKINMVNRCYHFFTGSKCSPELVTAMAVVVNAVRAVIAATAVTVAVALVIALVAALIALAEVIAGLLAAAAEAAAELAAIGAAIEGLRMLLNSILNMLPSAG